MSSTALVVIGTASVLLTLVHVIGGGKACARPMLDADFDRVARLTLYACWHYVTVHLLAGGLALVWIGMSGATPAGQMLAAAISMTYLAFAALFIAIAALSREPGGWLKFGQWIPFTAMGVAGLVAVT